MVKSEREIWWILDSGAGNGAFNMAVDEFLAKNIKKQPILRFYRWKPFCLSLGYGQKDNVFDYENIKRNKIDIVRRPTGGRAVLHGDEITYSVIIPHCHPFYSFSILELYKEISSALQNAMHNLGINAFIEKGNSRSNEFEKSSPYCFSSISRYEIKINGKKIIGSAQRRFKNSVLQHGSIPLKDSVFNYDIFISKDAANNKRKNILKDKISTLTDLLDEDISYDEVKNAVRKGFEDSFNIVFKEKKITKNQEKSVRNLSEKYII